MERKEFNLFDSLNVFLLCLFLPFVVSLFVVIFLMLFMGESFTTSFVYVILNLTISQVVFLAIYFIYKNKTKTSFKALKVNRISKKQVLIVVLIGLICVVCLTPLANVFEGILASLGHASVGLTFEVDSVWKFALVFFALAILAPMSEEIIFRGVIFNGLREKGGKFAVLISGLFFMLMHLSINQCFYQLIMGFVLGLLVLYTNSIVSSFLVHFINNAGVLLINYIIPSLSTTNYLSLTYILVAVALFIVAVFALYFSFKWLKSQRQEENKAVEVLPETSGEVVENGENSLNDGENLQLNENGEEKGEIVAENLETQNFKNWKKPERVYFTTSIILGASAWVLSVLITLIS